MRAQEHLDALQAEIDMYLRSNPYAVVSERNPDFQLTLQSSGGISIISSEWLHRISIHMPPPLRLSTVIGDCLTNCRAAIDHIAWQLVSNHLPGFDPVEDKTWVVFPLSSGPSDLGHASYTNKIGRMTNRNVPTDILDTIKNVQPHIRGYEPLLTLRELVNEDKHRMLLLTIGMLVGNVVFTFPPGSLYRSLTVPIGEDLKAASSAISSHHMNVQGQAHVTVTWQDVSMPREPVGHTLEQIIKTVADVVPRFDRFF